MPGARKRSPMSANSRSATKSSAPPRNCFSKSYDSVSINDIIEAAGGSEETIYSNFGNKKKLFEAVVQHMCAGVTIRSTCGRMEPLKSAHAHRKLVFVEGRVTADPCLSSADDIDREDIPRSLQALLQRQGRNAFISCSRSGSQSSKRMARSARIDAMRLAILFS